jgi:hypothetical protein
VLLLDLLPGDFAIVRLPPHHPTPDWPAAAPFCSITRTVDELSVVCPESAIPAGARGNGGWRCLRVRGPLDLSLKGVMASLAVPLAEADVAIFVVSTYDTDYLLVQAAALERARSALAAAGHHVTPEPGAAESSG